MRKSQKKQAEGFMELLEQVHEEIRKAIENQTMLTALALLADCQEGAIALGDLIEKAEGEDCKTIKTLEEYCELVYKIHEELVHKNTDNQEISAKVKGNQASGEDAVCEDNKKTLKDKSGQKAQGAMDGVMIYQSLREMGQRIKDSIQNDIKVRLEVVFLPYKASMWDSLESIWKAAEEDPDCDAYVLPIPYYDKKPDGSFGEIHYEGSQYPDNVPVIWYENYDFGIHKPDMIFIHNPYDECNFVTSVHPFFYSKNLKEYTDNLVYVPYFIFSEADPDDEKAVEEITHFCTVPGVIYADKVIVQSENIRKIYIKVMTKFMSGQRGYDRTYWKKKILGLGSPKIDKVNETERREIEIPENWLKVIGKPDGSRKKIILYNTCVTALLQHNEKYLEKMQQVFHTFYENRETVALLWRPHPLFGTTVEAMRQNLRAAYQGIVDKYLEEGWGIYDDTADLNRAIELSNGYYGDWSSVVTLYQETGKPVMIQTVESTTEQDNAG